VSNDTSPRPSAQATLLETALAYAKRGWRVFPLHTATNGGCSCGKDCGKDRGKHPRVKDWPHVATTDPEQIRRWWTRWRGANIAVLTGKSSGVVVIDIDPRNGGALTWEDLEAEHGKFPDTVESLTGGGGQHLFYQHPGGEVHRWPDTLGPGVDIKADGGYIVAPPSRHASGRQYEWEASSHPDNVAIAPLPAWFPLHEDLDEDLSNDQTSRVHSYTSEAGDDSPGDDFNHRATVEDIRAILTRHGWTLDEHRNGIDYLCRPGKTGRSHSATLGAVAPTVFYCFSTNGHPFQARRGYKPFSVYGLLEHGGDFRAAAKALADAGYGRQRVHDVASGQNGQGAGVVVDDLGESSTADETGKQGDPPEPQDAAFDDYILSKRTLCYRKPGTTVDQLLCNFMAWITEERLEDDGAELKRVVMLNAALASEKRFFDIAVSIADFYSLAGILKALGAEAVVSPGPLVKDRIRHAIQVYSNEKGYPHRQVFTHLGWRQVDGVWCYLHAAGAIPAKVEVSVEKALARYALPSISSAHAGIEASLRLLTCAPLRITVPLLSAVYLAPLAECLNPDLTEWLEGPSGARKSSLAALMLCHYGAFDRVHPPDSWESTANELERLAFLAKDTLLWIDDYAPRPSAKEMHEQERKAQRVIRAQGNLSGRGRMRADMSLRPAYYPRGVTLSTGELHPTGTSTFARMLQLDVEPDDVNLKALAACQAESYLLAEAMAAYIQWLQPQLTTLAPALKARWMELRAGAQSQLTHHTRQPEVFAHLAVAWELFLGFACEMDVLSDEERQERRTAGLEALTEAINRQRVDAESEDPAHRFCHLIREALTQGKAYLDDTQGWYPADAGQWGWTLHTIHHHDGTTTDEWKPAPGASMLGWLDQDFLYLLPDASYRLAFENLQRAGMVLLPQQALWKLLIQRGYVQRGKDRLTTVKAIQGRSRRVLMLSRKKLEGGVPSQSGNTGNSGNDKV
jgi:hypothetical protein